MPPRKPSLLERINTLEPAPPWGFSAVLLSLVVAFIAVVASVGFVTVWMGDRPSAFLAGWTIAGLLMTLFVFQSRRAPQDRLALRLARQTAPLPLLLVLNLGLAMLLDVVSLAVTGRQFLPVPELIALVQAPRDAFAWVFAVVLMLVAQPIGEELIFRGVAQPVLRVALGAWPGLLLASLVYGGFHLIAYPPSYLDVPRDAMLWYGLLLPSLQGLVFGLNRAATGSTRAAILAHMAFGLFAVLRVLIVVS